MDLHAFKDSEIEAVFLKAGRLTTFAKTLGKLKQVDICSREHPILHLL